MPFYIYVFMYLIIINLVAAAVTIFDKQRAIRRGRRIPERVLLLLAALGGSPLMMAVMLLIRHKTKHLKFMLGIPAIMILQAALCFFIYFFTK